MAMRKGGDAKTTMPATPPPSGGDWHIDVKRQLLRRIGVAALLIVALLGGLALFDHLNTPGEAIDDEEYSEPAQTRRSEEIKPVRPAEAPIEKPADLAVAAPAEVPRKSTEEPASKESSPSSARVTGPAPAAGKPSSVAATAPAASTDAKEKNAPPDFSAPPPPPEVPARPVLPPPAVAGKAAPASPARPAVDVPAITLRARAGYVVQSDALPDATRAEEVRQRLAQAGIPATVETRVEVGPFRNRAEADSARRKMNALGIAAATLWIKGSKP